MTLPNFYIIGANKAGTTSLYYYLDQHPDIFMCWPKEPMFFMAEDINDDIRNRPDAQHLKIFVGNFKDYSALFDKVSDERAIGEASTGYLPNYNVPQRIKKYTPEAKFIAILRNPVDRAYSAYTYALALGIEPLNNFSQAIEEAQSNNWRHYVKLGLYCRQLLKYYETFNKNQIRIYLYDDLRSDPLSLVKSIFQFLEVDDSFIPDISKEHNVTLIPKNKMMHLLLTKLTAISTNIEPMIPINVSGLFNKMINLNLTKPPKLDIQTRKDLIEVYREDILKLQDLLQRDLTSWLD